MARKICLTVTKVQSTTGIFEVTDKELEDMKSTHSGKAIEQITKAINAGDVVDEAYYEYEAYDADTDEVLMDMEL